MLAHVLVTQIFNLCLFAAFSTEQVQHRISHRVPQGTLPHLTEPCGKKIGNPRSKHKQPLLQGVKHHAPSLCVDRTPRKEVTKGQADRPA